MTTNKPTIRAEIEAILDCYDQDMSDTSSTTYEKAIAKATNQILDLIDKEVIGEDEIFVKPTTKRRTYAEIAKYARQGLKNEQRTLLRGKNND